MEKEEYIERFAARICTVKSLPPDDELARYRAEREWLEHESGDTKHMPEFDADFALGVLQS